MNKEKINDLAIFGGEPLFVEYKSTSNLLQPDIDKFLMYSKNFYEQQQYTNNGPNVKLLERRLADFHHSKYCITFSSGFWGLALAAKVLALKDKNEIIMPSLTYRRMTDMSAWVGLSPRFCEVDESTLSMTVETVEECINENTALILGVHPIVNCCESEKLVALARRYKIPILFDSVESAYESCEGGKVGEFGDAECFSLHACKLFNGFGGGYLTTNNQKLTEQLSAMRTFGFTKLDHVGFKDSLNVKLNEMHACMALASLDDIEAQVEANKARYLTYKNKLTSIFGVRLLEFDERYDSGYKNIVVEILDDWPFSRNQMIRLLNAERVLARAHYDPPLHLKKMNYEYVKADLPLTESLSTRFLNLPCGQKVSIDDIERILELFSFISENAVEVKNNMLKQVEL